MLDKKHSANQLDIVFIECGLPRWQPGKGASKIRQSARFDVSNKRLTNKDTWLVLETARPMFGVAELIVGSKNMCMVYGPVQSRLLRGQQGVRTRC